MSERKPQTRMPIVFNLFYPLLVGAIVIGVCVFLGFTGEGLVEPDNSKIYRVTYIGSEVSHVDGPISEMAKCQARLSTHQLAPNAVSDKADGADKPSECIKSSFRPAVTHKPEVE